ncbi:hypothetical protein RCC89_11850 [Cytophagaceae bacterium ABcell3]|nr:hypothetical protein RCC89_11850 [Cytophagaceae bacterium ABcell3]
MKDTFYSSLLLLLLSALLIFSSCRREDRVILGAWQLREMYTMPADTNVAPDTLQPEQEEVYIFSPDGTYTLDKIVERQGDEDLVIMRGSWEMTTVQENDQDRSMLRLREKQLNRVVEKSYQIERLAEDTLIWNDRRRLRYFFSRVEDNN